MLYFLDLKYMCSDFNIPEIGICTYNVVMIIFYHYVVFFFFGLILYDFT